jgi:hypothetical protein
MWIILGDGDFRSKGSSFWVNVNGLWRFNPRTLNHAASGYALGDARGLGVGGCGDGYVFFKGCAPVVSAVVHEDVEV